MPGSTIQGACLCGLVRYELTGPLTHAHHCHCVRCRKHHGSSFATYVMWPLEGFRYLAGEDRIRGYQSTGGFSRNFCPVCASVLPTAMPEHGIVVGPAGNLEGSPAVQPGLHMFTASRAPWYTITDGLPQHPTAPEEFGITPLADPRAGLAPAAPRLTRGSCLCGAVAFEYAGKPLRMMNCHCSRCRKGRSAAHATNLFVGMASFAYTRGQELLGDYRVPGARYFGIAFCQECGSDVPRLSVERGAAVVPAGSLDDDPGMTPAGHIFVGSKASWFTITDKLPQFEAMPPA